AVQLHTWPPGDTPDLEDPTGRGSRGRPLGPPGLDRERARNPAPPTRPSGPRRGGVRLRTTLRTSPRLHVLSAPRAHARSGMAKGTGGVRPKVLFIGGSLNQTSMLHAIGRELTGVDAYYTPHYCDGYLEGLRRAGLLDRTVLGGPLKKLTE